MFLSLAPSLSTTHCTQPVHWRFFFSLGFGGDRYSEFESSCVTLWSEDKVMIFRETVRWNTHTHTHTHTHTNTHICSHAYSTQEFTFGIFPRYKLGSICKYIRKKNLYYIIFCSSKNLRTYNKSIVRTVKKLWYIHMQLVGVSKEWNMEGAHVK